MITDCIKAFSSKLEQGAVIGAFSKTSDPAFIEIMGFSGMDFVIIDLEHGPNNIQTAQNLIRAAQLSKVFPIVRIKEETPDIIGSVLDIDAGGIQIPNISSAAEAEALIKKAKFAPAGMRGVCRFVRSAGYSTTDRFKYFREANAAMIIAQIESREAIENIDTILDVEGVDVIFVGPYDLSQSLGVPGEIDHPLVKREIENIVRKAAAKSVAVGIFVDCEERLKEYKRMGVKYLAYSVDVGLFADACRNVVNSFNNEGAV